VSGSTDNSPAREPVETAERGLLRESALRGVRWISLARAAAELGALASSVVLAHLIPPSEFGRAALAGLVSAILATVAFRGLGAPLIKRQRLERRHVQTGFLLSLGAGALLAAAAFVIATLAFDPLFGEGVAGLGRLASLALLVGGVGTVPRALLLRRLDFRRTSGVDIASLAAGVIASVALALAGLDAEALVVGGLIAATADAALMLALAPVPPPRWDRSAARELASFGLPAGLASFLNAAARNVDYAILGARLNPAQVGLYWRAYALGVDSQSKLSGVMMQLALPVYSRAADLDDMRRLRFRVTRLHATGILPLLALLIALAPVAVPWVFGAPWEPAVVPTQILAVGGMAAALGSGTGSFVLAAGRPWHMVRFNLALLALFATVVFLTAPLGLVEVCVAVAGVRLVLLIGDYHVLLRPLIGVPVRRLWAEVVPGAASSAILLAVAWPLTELMVAAALPAAAILALVTAIGAAVYLLSLHTLFPATLADLALVARRIARRGPAPPEVAPAAGLP
jgi:O-antigen/teichoic acid export membrane protein